MRQTQKTGPRKTSRLEQVRNRPLPPLHQGCSRKGRKETFFFKVGTQSSLHKESFLGQICHHFHQPYKPALIALTPSLQSLLTSYILILLPACPSSPARGALANSYLTSEIQLKISLL